jgi:hypothetical protein
MRPFTLPLLQFVLISITLIHLPWLLTGALTCGTTDGIDRFHVWKTGSAHLVFGLNMPPFQEFFKYWTCQSCIQPTFGARNRSMPATWTSRAQHLRLSLRKTLTATLTFPHSPPIRRIRIIRLALMPFHLPSCRSLTCINLPLIMPVYLYRTISISLFGMRSSAYSSHL